MNGGPMTALAGCPVNGADVGHTPRHSALSAGRNSCQNVILAIEFSRRNKPVRTAAQYLGYLGVRVFVCALQSLRMETCQTIAAGLATLACDVIRLRRKVVEENLQYALPDLTDNHRPP